MFIYTAHAEVLTARGRRRNKKAALSQGNRAMQRVSAYTVKLWTSRNISGIVNINLYSFCVLL